MVCATTHFIDSFESIFALNSTNLDEDLFVEVGVYMDMYILHTVAR